MLIFVKKRNSVKFYTEICYNSGKRRKEKEGKGMRTENQARALMARHHHLIKNRQQSMLGRTAAELGIDINPTEYWNPVQGKPNPTFRVTYDRSHAGLS